VSGAWQVRLDDGQSSTCADLGAAEEVARTVLSTHHAAEIWHFGSMGWELHERLEPRTEDRESLAEAIRRGRRQVLDAAREGKQ